MTCSKLVHGLLRDSHKIVTSYSFSLMKNLSQACEMVLRHLSLVNKLVIGKSIHMLSDVIKTAIRILPGACNRLATRHQWPVTGLQQFFFKNSWSLFNLISGERNKLLNILFFHCKLQKVKKKI